MMWPQRILSSALARRTQLGLKITSKDTLFSSLAFTQVPMTNFDVAWVLSLGRRQTFLDNLQLLKLLETQLRVINTPEAIPACTAKYRWPASRAS